MTENEVIALAKKDAKLAIDIARREVGPITWITNNNYMPPLRAFGHAESVWQDVLLTDEAEAWYLYVETFEESLDNASVYLGSPDYDNALYVVDLKRWQYDEDNARDEWHTLVGDVS